VRALALLAALGLAAALSTGAPESGPATVSEAPIVVAGSEPATALTGPETFLEANSAYEVADYARAAMLYRSLIDNDHDSGYLHYDLGNAYLRNGELGRAIASYRRAWLRLPREEDVLANLEFARKTTQDALAAPGPSAVTRALFFWHYGMSITELQWAALGLNLLFWLLVAIRLVNRRSEVLRWLTVAVLIPLIAVALSLGLRWLDPPLVAVVVPQEVNAHSGPDADEVVRFKLHAGTEVELRDRRDDWLRIALPDGQQGWIEAEFAEIVVG
jgi:tetratricopeptide (TPR) repeat protein